MAHNSGHGTSQVPRLGRLQPENERLEQKVRQLQEEVAYLENILAEHKCRPACVQQEKSQEEPLAARID